MCKYLSDFHKRLLFFKAEEVDEFKINFKTEIDKCSGDIKHLSKFCNSIIADFQKQVECLKVKGMICIAYIVLWRISSTVSLTEFYKFNKK